MFVEKMADDCDSDTSSYFFDEGSPPNQSFICPEKKFAFVPSPPLSDMYLCCSYVAE